VSDDESLVGLGSIDGTALVFRVDRPQRESVRLQHSGRVTALAFSADNRLLVTASSDRHPNRIEEDESYPMHWYLLQPTDLIAEARARLAPFAASANSPQVERGR
jgi:hypothetical protein